MSSESRFFPLWEIRTAVSVVAQDQIAWCTSFRCAEARPGEQSRLGGDAGPGGWQDSAADLFREPARVGSREGLLLFANRPDPRPGIQVWCVSLSASGNQGDCVGSRSCILTDLARVFSEHDLANRAWLGKNSHASFSLEIRPPRHVLSLVKPSCWFGVETVRFVGQKVERKNSQLWRTGSGRYESVAHSSVMWSVT